MRKYKWLYQEAQSLCETIPNNIETLKNMEWLLVKKDLELLVKFEEYFPDHDEQNSPFVRRSYVWDQKNLDSYSNWVSSKEVENEVNRLLNRIQTSNIARNSQTLSLVIEKISRKLFSYTYPISSPKKYKKIIFFKAIDYIQQANHINGYPNFILPIKTQYEQILRDLINNKIKLSDYESQLKLWIEEINQKFLWQYQLIEINPLDPDRIVIKPIKGERLHVYPSLYVFHDKVFRKKIEEEILPFIRKIYGRKDEKEEKEKFNKVKKWSELLISHLVRIFKSFKLFI